MNRILKKSAALVISALLLFCAPPVSGGLIIKSFAATYTGACGDSVVWSFNTSTGLLGISGTGAMWDYSIDSLPPWYQYRTGMSDINIQNGILNIGNYAFYGCSALNTSEALPNSVRTVGDYAFYGCPLQGITFPSELTQIGNHAFQENASLSSIRIKLKLIRLGDYAFADCTGLTQLTFDEGVLRSIGDYAFYNCLNLDTVYFPESLISIGKSAFRLCYNLSEIHFGDKLNTIGEYAFTGCTNDLSNVVIPESVAAIGQYAFSDCAALASVSVHDPAASNLKTLGEGVFHNTAWFNALPVGIVVFGNMIYKYKGGNASGTQIIDKSLADAAFAGCVSMTGITLTEDVRTIGSRAFTGCDGLTAVVIPSQVFEIREETFAGCSHLSSVEIGDGVALLGSRAFYGCAALTNLSIPDAVTAVESKAFGDCAALTTLTVGSGTAFIASDAFEGCGNLRNLNFNALDCVLGTDTDYGYTRNPFTDCKKITQVNVGASCRVIPDNFMLSHDDTMFTGLTVSAGVERIGTNAFSGCGWLSAVVIPGSVRQIGNNAFYGCERLDTLQLLNGIQSIGVGAFYGCRALTGVTVPGSVTSIGSKAFYNCSSIGNVYFGDGLTSIGIKAFYGCEGLQGAYFAGDAPEASTEVFGVQGPHFKVYYLEAASGFTNPWYGYTTEVFAGRAVLACVGSDTVIDHARGFIYGLETGITKTLFENQYVYLRGNVRLEYPQGSILFGTGTVVKMVDNMTGEVLEMYTLVIYGDTNGDGNIDTSDAGLIVDVENWVVEWDTIADAARYEAADLNGDGNVDSSDAGLVVDTENFLLEIDQVTGLAA